MRLIPASLALLSALAGAPALAQVPECPSPTPVQGGAIGPTVQVFPANNWWNVDISAAPIDVDSEDYIDFINNGGTRRLHPDFGGEESEGSETIYGFPYAVVSPSQPKVAVTFDYWDESDGVDMDTGEGVPFYPVPTQAITQPHWIEGGAPGNVDQREDNDRHLLMVDCEGRKLYELYNVWHDTGTGRWYGGSGAYFDLTRNDRRPEGWTSADAAGLAIFPGLVRYDEAANPAVPEINHAFRVTVRATDGYVYPASHAAGDTFRALPMGARLRLRSTVDGLDPALRTSDPVARKIFRAMQKYGLIVADNGTDMYISGTFDVRWDNGVLNPAFRSLTADDFEVVQLGWQPYVPPDPVLTSVTANPNPIEGGTQGTGTVQLFNAALAGGARVNLSSASPDFSVPASVTVPQGATQASFPITTQPVEAPSTGTLSASFDGVTHTVPVMVTPPLPTLRIGDLEVVEGHGGDRAARLKVFLDEPALVDVEFRFSTADGSATGNVDYVAVSNDIAGIAAGDVSRVIEVRIIGDTELEPDQAFRINLHDAQGAHIGDGVAVVRIRNDDFPVISIADVKRLEGDAGTQYFDFQVKLSAPPAMPVRFDATTASASAVAGSDYVARTVFRRTMDVGQQFATFRVTVNGDTAVEPNERFLARLHNVFGATLGDVEADGMIRNDDGPTLSIANASTIEGDVGNGKLNFTVSLSEPAAVPVQYTVQSQALTAQPGSDYVTFGPVVHTLLPGVTERSFSVTVLRDTTPEPDESLLVVLSAASGATITNSAASGTITDDD